MERMDWVAMNQGGRSRQRLHRPGAQAAPLLCYLARGVVFGLLLTALFACLGSRSLAMGANPTPEALIKAGHWKRARAVIEPHYQLNPNDALASF